MIEVELRLKLLDKRIRNDEVETSKLREDSNLKFKMKRKLQNALNLTFIVSNGCSLVALKPNRTEINLFI